MPEPKDDVERVIVAAISRHSNGSPAALARMIVEELWEVGYDVTPRPDIIPIRRNPGDDAASPLCSKGKARFSVIDEPLGDDRDTGCCQ